MVLEPFYTDASQIPEALREHYVERDGRHVLAVAERDGWALENVKGLRSAHAKSSEENRVLRETAKRFREKVGTELSPEEIAERLVKYDELIKIDPEKQADELARKRLEATERALQEKYERRIKQEWEPIKQELEEERAFTRKLLIDTKVSEALLEAGVEPEALDLLKDRLAKSCRVRIDSETKTRVVDVLDEYGNPRVGENPMKQAAEELRSKYPQLFKGTEASGSGARPSNSGSGGGGRRYTDAEIAAMSQQEYEAARRKGLIR